VIALLCMIFAALWLLSGIGGVNVVVRAWRNVGDMDAIERWAYRMQIFLVSSAYAAIYGMVVSGILWMVIMEQSAQR
jgi:hypothetical protein